MTNLFIMKHLGYYLHDFIKICHWKEDFELCQNVIKDRVLEENKKYLEKKLGGLRHLRDRRSNEEYALDLILGWAVEDAMRDIFNETLQLNTSLNSADKKREFLTSPKASSDFIIYLTIKIIMWRLLAITPVFGKISFCYI